jgi:hypothetical protein
MTCPQLAGLRPGPPRTPDGCDECLKAGTQWVHLWAWCYADEIDLEVPSAALGFVRR